MHREGTFAKLMSYLEGAIEAFPDIRSGDNCVYSIRDAAISAFSVFFMQSPSFLSHQNMMEQEKGNNNVRTLFGAHQIPTDNSIRGLLDPVSPEYCFDVIHKIHNQLLSEEIKDKYRSINDTYLIAIDGTWFHSSETIHCDECSYKDHKDGRRTWYHHAITPVYVHPQSHHVLSLEPEFIIPQDGREKQDCEINAAKRWLKGNGEKYALNGVTLLGDDIYARDPFCKEAVSGGFHFLFTCKKTSHKSLYHWVEDGEEGKDIFIQSGKFWTGKERQIHTYRYFNDIPIKDTEDAIRVNWCELEIRNKSGKVTGRFAYVTDHEITGENVMDVVKAGRARWKIENEHNKTLKTNGYNLEHNFGHGKRHLANLLLTMNLLAFLFHTVLELYDESYQLLRKTVGARKVFFNDIRALTRYMVFKHWSDLMVFMLKGLDLPIPGG